MTEQEARSLKVGDLLEFKDGINKPEECVVAQVVPDRFLVVVFAETEYLVDLAGDDRNDLAGYVLFTDLERKETR